MADKQKKQATYREYSDDSWFTTVMNELSKMSPGGCCLIPMLAAISLFALAAWVVSMLA